MNRQTRIIALFALLGLQNVVFTYAQGTNDATPEKVEYIKNVSYIEPHDNMPPSYKPYIIKQTTDKNGKVKSTYYGIENLSYMCCGVEKTCYPNHYGGDIDATYLYGDIPVYYKSTPAIRYGNYQNYHSEPLVGKGEIDILYMKTGVPDVSKVEFTHTIRNRNKLDWDYFSNLSHKYEPDEISEYDTNHARGMIVQAPDVISEYDVKYPIFSYYGDLELWPIRGDHFSSHSYIIQRYYLDGQSFDFFPFSETWDPDIRIEYITMPNGMPAKVVTIDQQTKTLGRDMYQCHVDTIYQLTPEEVAQMEAVRTKARSLSTPNEMMPKPNKNMERRDFGLRTEGESNRRKMK